MPPSVLGQIPIEPEQITDSELVQYTTLVPDDEGFILLRTRDLKLALVGLSNELLHRERNLLENFARSNAAVSRQLHALLAQHEEQIRLLKEKEAFVDENIARRVSQKGKKK